MGFLQYAYKISVGQRKLVAFLVIVFALSSSNVQAAEISSIESHGQEVGQTTATMTVPPGLILPPAYFDTTTSSTSSVTTTTTSTTATTTTTVRPHTSVSLSAPSLNDVVATTTIQVTITAFSSAPNETDGSPFVTASGACVRDGIVAANFLPFGTLLKLPGLFGDKVFEVEDRMADRFNYRLDVWMGSKPEAFRFGIRHNVHVEIVQKGDNKNVWSGRHSDHDCQQVAAASVSATK